MAGQRARDREERPARGDHLPFGGFRTDEAARAGFGRCRDALPDPDGRGGRTLDRRDVERCFHEQGSQAPPPEFVEAGFHHWLHVDDDPIAVSDDWPKPCQPQPLPGDPTATVLAEGDLGGLPWSIVAYEGADGTVCATCGTGSTVRVSSEGTRASRCSPVARRPPTTTPAQVGAPRYWANMAAGEHSARPGSGIAFFWAPVRPDVTRVRITFDGQSHDVATVASPLAPDRRFVAAGLPHDGWFATNARYGAVLYDATGREVGRLGR